jgi:hypothetical protein
MKNLTLEQSEKKANEIITLLKGVTERDAQYVLNRVKIYISESAVIGEFTPEKLPAQRLDQPPQG